MKIAHFYDGIYVNGGVSGYIQSLTKLQIAAGDEVSYFELRPTEPNDNGIRPLLIEDENALFRICQAQAVDVLHMHRYATALPPPGLNTVYTVHEHSPHCMSGGLFLKNRGIPCPRTYNIVGCCYGHIRDHCGSVRPAKFIQNYQRVHLQKAILPHMKIVSVGHFLKNRMVKAGYPGEKIRVIPNFTDMNMDPDTGAALPAGVPEFLFMGRLEKLKGVDWLLRAFRNVAPPAVLNICGEGGEEKSLRELARQLGMEDRVKFWGWVDRDGKRKLLQAARALIVPSIWHETFGLVAIEAAACARPVIVSDAGELPYLVDDGKDGLVVKVGDISQLSKAIQDLANDPQKARQMGTNNQLKCKTLYTPQAHKSQIDEVYAAC
jgi:glycosyltransferase involved in cell wall biosynthesis